MSLNQETIQDFPEKLNAKDIMKAFNDFLKTGKLPKESENMRIEDFFSDIYPKLSVSALESASNYS